MTNIHLYDIIDAMKHAEIKFEVDSFKHVEDTLQKLGAKKGTLTVLINYYARQDSKDVVKLVHYPDRDEINILVESNGTFLLKDRIAVDSTEAGLEWLKNKGYSLVDVVEMHCTEYEYADGTIGLYLINGWLHSVILDFPSEEHEDMKERFDLTRAQEITIPYNLYLERAGKVQSLTLKGDA
jgi:hypothetical protein